MKGLTCLDSPKLLPFSVIFGHDWFMAAKLDIIAKFPGITILHQKIPGQEVGRHIHDEHEFFLPLHGELTVKYENKAVKAGPGRMLYIPPDLDHSFSSSANGSGERVIWLIEKKTMKLHTSDSFLPSVFPANSLVKELIFYLLVHQKIEGQKYFISALVQSIIESLKAVEVFGNRDLRLVHILGKVQDSRVRYAIELMESDLGTIAISEVAEKSGMSLRNFNRLFLKETGLTPKDLLVSQRIEKAKTLLKVTKRTVTDISFEVGYNSLSKFIAAFKKIEGVLPSDFMESKYLSTGE